MSLAFVGRIVQSLKGFYNGINPATLTGAIDVVIVKQPDGSYHSSPFHVRFGKLGVLRSREKVVDIEINGEPIDLHMKLGEAGEAFFVQEIESEEEDDESLVLLATSPLPCPEHMVEGVKDLHRQEGSEGQTVVDLSAAVEQDAELRRTYHNYSKRSSISSNASSLASSPRSHTVSTTPAIDITGSGGSGVKPRRKVLKKKKQKQQQSSHHHHKSGRSGMRSVSMPEGVSEEAAMFELDESSTSDESGEESLKNLTPVGEGAAWRLSNLHSTSSPDVKVYDINFDDENQYKGTTSHRRMSSLGNVSFMTTPFSEPETSPITSPRVSRPSTPKSDTEVDKQHTEESQTSALMENSATWAWGMFPTNLEAALPQAQQGNKGGQEAEIKVISDADPSKEDTDRTAKSSGGFMSIWTKPSPSSSAQSTSSNTATGTAVTATTKTESLEGIYLDDLTSMDDPEMARIYLGQPREKEEDTESGRGQSLPQSPNSVEGAIGGPVSFTMSEVRHLGPVALSLCGGLNEPDTLTLDKFMQKVVTFEDLAENPNITTNPDLVVKIHDKFYNWITAGPMVLSQIVFHKSLPDPAVRDLEKEHMPKKKKVKKGWFSWGRSADALEEEGSVLADPAAASTAAAAATTSPASGAETAEQTAAQTSPVESPSSTPPHSNMGSPRKHRAHRSVREETTTSTETDTDHSEKEASSTSTAPHTKPSSPPQRAKRLVPDTATSEPTAAAATPCDDNDEGSSSSTTKGKRSSVVLDLDVQGEPVVPSESLDDDILEGYHERRQRHSSQESNGEGVKTKRERFIKSLRLSSEQISKMGLREGHNEMVFSVTTQYQGTTRCVSSVYLWNHDDKIVISDIDGTITKSDVLGQIMPIIGRDWWQSGVAQLFTRIDQNGYKLIYLSARAIGQSRSTKDMLKSIRQGGLVLPDGPLFLNPTSLFSAFHREVIQKNPEEFKISCLKDIACLFPNSPFIAGFGNKLNDVIAYRALDIPKSRIFTINPQGQLRHDLSITFQSSYTGMSDLVDHLFPARDHVDRGAASEYTGVAYWRQPIPTLSDAELALLGCDIKTGPVAAITAPATVSSAAAAGSALLAGETKIEVQIEAPKQ